MKVSFSKNFIKQAKKLSPTVRQKLQQRLTQFSKDPLHSTLRNHALKGRWKSYRSIDITGDTRAIYQSTEKEVFFVAVGTHSQLYG